MPCSETCGDGWTSRFRSCLTSTCVGTRLDSKQCAELPCWGEYKVSGRVIPNRFLSLLNHFDCPDTMKMDFGCSTSKPFICVDMTCVCYSKECSPLCFTVGVWQPWLDWSACSSSCGPGRQHRSRTCRGRQCEGTGIQSQPCENDCDQNGMNL